MLEDIWPHVLENNSIMHDLEIFENGNKFMVRYNLKLIETVSMSEFIEFEEDKISKIEVFIGRKSKIN